jgi:hypothetical protein
MADRQTYRSMMRRPTAEEGERGARYILWISGTRDVGGSILRPDSTPLWHYETRPRRHPWSPLCLFCGKPRFVLKNPEGGERVLIRRVRRFPARFQIDLDGQAVGSIDRVGFLRNKYRLVLPGGSTWIVQMPLFSVDHGAWSESGALAWIAEGPSKRQWSVLIQEGADSLPLLAGLAFIHRERWCYS